MPIDFNTRPICEICKDEPADAFYAMQQEGITTVWMIAGRCAENENLVGYPIYDIGFDRLFAGNLSVLNWLEHLSQKRWFSPEDFGRALVRLARASGAHP